MIDSVRIVRDCIAHKDDRPRTTRMKLLNDWRFVASSLENS